MKGIWVWVVGAIIGVAYNWLLPGDYHLVEVNQQAWKINSRTGEAWFFDSNFYPVETISMARLQEAARNEAEIEYARSLLIGWLC
jgi:hypothetical protein